MVIVPSPKDQKRVKFGYMATFSQFPQKLCITSFSFCMQFLGDMILINNCQEMDLIELFER